MKKIALLCLLILSGFAFSSCQIVDSLGFSKSVITIVNDDSSYDQEIIIGSSSTIIEVPTKEGYYLKGIYDSTEGGTKYFHGTGAVSTPWQRRNSSKLYTQWGALSEIDYESGLFSNGQWGSSVYYLFDSLSHDLRAAILSNPERNMNIKINYSIKASSYFSNNLNISVYAYAEKNKFGEVKFNTSSEWKEQTTTIRIPGKAFTTKGLYLYFDTNSGSSITISAPMVYVDELKIKITY